MTSTANFKHATQTLGPKKRTPFTHCEDVVNPYKKPRLERQDAVLATIIEDDPELSNEATQKLNSEDDSEGHSDADIPFESIFREECQAWLLDNGKAFFRVEALAFMRTEKKKDQDKLALKNRK